MAERIAQRKSADEVFDRLIDLIRSGEIGPGDTLPSERNLVARFGVTRPAARAALQRIGMMGLSTIRQGERSRLNALTPALALRQTEAIAALLAGDPQTTAHMREARHLLETWIAARAAEQARDEDIVALAGLIRTQKAADEATFAAADVQFHLRIAEICGNPVITAALEALIRAVQASCTDPSPEARRRSVQEHKRIVGALARSDSALAAARMGAHLADAP